MNTYYWIDRTAGITGAIYSQFLPFAAPGMLAMNVEFDGGAGRPFYDHVRS